MNSRVGKDFGSFLEGSRRQERFGRESRFGNTEQDPLRHCGSAAVFEYSCVLFVERKHIHAFARKETRITARKNFDLTKHLIDYDFDVFIVNVNALTAVNGLNFS